VKVVHGKPHLSVAKVRIGMLRSTRFKCDAYQVLIHALCEAVEARLVEAGGKR